MFFMSSISRLLVRRGLTRFVARALVVAALRSLGATTSREWHGCFLLYYFEES
jgi:hypothetical protein